MSSRAVKFLLDLLFPPRCVFCGKLLRDGEEHGLCGVCQEKLPWITGRAAEQKLEFVSLCASPLWYQGEVRESVRRYKFSGRSAYARAYGHLAAQCVQDHLSGKFDLISWPPLSKERLKERGYDQAMLLARATAEELGVPLVRTLNKVRHTDAQSGLHEDSARRANVLGVYELAAPVEGKRILLIDDVVTTGSTLSECARVLRTNGAADVVCVTLARARGTRENARKKNEPKIVIWH